MDIVTPAAPAAPAAAPANAATEVVDPNATAAPEVKPERTFSQKELDEIVERRLAKEARKRREVETRLKVTEELALRRNDPQPEKKPSADAEPKREQFDTYEAFIEARADWRADQKVEKRFAERDQKSQQEKTQAEQKTRSDDFRKRVKELAKDLPDFDAVMAEATSDPEGPVSRLFVEPIQECENPAAVLHHLAKNLEEAERIASLEGNKQAREIWALDAKLKSAPVVKKPSNAPEPITPIGGKSTKGDDEPDPKSKEWGPWRDRQVAARKKGT